ncbi:hypothetical protein QUA45_24610 [Microcoleus sp. Pol12A5]
MLHYFQEAFYEQAFRPVPQRVNFIVEQAGKPVLEKGQRCEIKPSCIPLNLWQISDLFHQLDV